MSLWIGSPAATPPRPQRPIKTLSGLCVDPPSRCLPSRHGVFSCCQSDKPTIEVSVLPEERSQARAEIEAAIAARNFPLARSALVSFWAADSTPASAPFVVSRFEKLRGHFPFTPCRLAMLRSFTLEPLLRCCGPAPFAAASTSTCGWGFQTPTRRRSSIPPLALFL